ncbi:hypothetical protein BHE74_00022600 [Ensete ventricosum]|nr:hypothetical protein BHE74_00022600 [Ensete ventricosum]
MMLQGCRVYNFQVVDIYWKMATEESKSGGSCDGGGRSGQQQHQLRLRCDFVSAGGVGVHGCNRGKTGQRSARLLQRRTAVVWRERLLLVMFTSMLAVIKVVGSERLLRLR